MKIKDCYRKIKNDSSFRHIFWENYQKAKQSYDWLIEAMKDVRPGVKIVLHHLDLGCDNYEEWEPVIPMFFDEHLRLHSLITKGRGKYGVMSDDESYARLRYIAIIEAMTVEERKQFYLAQSERKRKVRLLNGDVIRKHAREYCRKNSEKNKIRCRKYRTNLISLETEEEKQERLAQRRGKDNERKEKGTAEKRTARLASEAAYARKRRGNETPEQRKQRLDCCKRYNENNKEALARKRKLKRIEKRGLSA